MPSVKNVPVIIQAGGVADHTVAIATLTNDIADIKNLINNIKATGGNVNQAEINALKQSLSTLVTRFDASDKVTIKAFKDAHKALTDVSKDLANKIKDNIKSINANRKAVNDLTTVTEQNKNVTIDAVSKLETELRALINQLGAKLDLVDDHEVKIGAIETDITNIKTTITTNANVQGVLTQEQVQALAEVPQHTAILNDHGNDINNLKVSDTYNKNKLDTLDKAIKAVGKVDNQHLNEVSARSIVNQNNLATYKALIDVNIREIDDLVHQVDSVETDVTEAKKDIEDRINPELTNIKSDIAQLKPLTTKVSDVEDKLKLTSDHVNDLNTHITDLSQLNNDAITNVIASVDAMGTSIASSLQSHDAKIQTAEAQAELNRTNIEKLEADVKQLPTKDDVKKSVDHLDVMYGDALRGIVPSVEKLREQAKETADRCTNSEMEVTNLATRINNLSALKDGKDGKDAVQYYTHIQFSTYQDGKTSRGQTVFGTAGAEYMGVITNSTEKDAPKDADQYRWVRTRGLDGVEGAKGDPGTTLPALETHIMFASDAQGSLMNDQHGGAYIGFRPNQPPGTKKSWIATDYVWSRIQGKDGVDGKSEYIHTVFSKHPFGVNSSGVDDIRTSFPAEESQRRYYGFCITDSKKPPITASSYKWSRLSADNRYTHFVYSKYPSGRDARGNISLSSVFDPDEQKPYIGILSNAKEDRAPSDPDRYVWHKTGFYEPPLETRVVYSEYPNGFDRNNHPSFTIDPKGDPKYIYMGIRHNVKPHEHVGASRDTLPLYKFTKIIPSKGDKGQPGDKGDNSYIHIRYSNSKKGADKNNVVDMHEELDGAKYIGFQVSNSPKASKVPEDYSWSSFKGERGRRGEAGESLLIHVRFSNYEDGESSVGVPSFDSNPVGKKYIGFELNSKSKTASTDAQDYFWYQLGHGEKGEKGDKGDPGIGSKQEVKEWVAEIFNASNLVRKSELDRVSNGIQVVNNRVDTLEKDVTDLKAKPITPTVDLTAINQQIASNKSDIDTLQASVDVVDADYADIKNKFKTVEVDLANLKAKPDPIPTDLKPIETRVAKVETDIAALKANPVVPQPNVPVDLTHITDKVNKFASDVTTLSATVGNHTNRLTKLGDAISTASRDIAKNVTNITSLQGADTALSGRIDNLDTEIKAVGNRVNNLVVSAGNVATAEMQTIKDSITKLRSDHKAELDKLQNKKASHSYVRSLIESIDEAKGSLGEAVRQNQMMEGRVTQMEIAQRSFVHKRDVDNAVDPFRKALSRIDTLESDFKALSSNATNADNLSKSNQTKIDDLKAKVDGYDTKIQNFADDLAKVTGGTAATTQDLSDLSKELKAEIKTLDDSIEPKITSYVDKKLKGFKPTGVNHPDVTQLQTEVTRLTTLITTLETKVKEFVTITTFDATLKDRFEQFETKLNEVIVDAQKYLETQFRDLFNTTDQDTFWTGLHAFLTKVSGYFGKVKSLDTEFNAFKLTCNKACQDSIDQKTTDLDNRVTTLANAHKTDFDAIGKKHDEFTKALDGQKKAILDDFTKMRADFINKNNMQADKLEKMLRVQEKLIKDQQVKIRELEDAIKKSKGQKVKFKYSANKDGSNPTDIRGENTRFVGIEID